MSLDVYLTLQGECNKGSGIFVRENGETKEISREEWDSKFPGREPIVANVTDIDDGEVFSANITHNLNKMANEAGIYKHLWRPDELGVTKASELIQPLRNGLILLKSNPDFFKRFNPENGWGSYEGLIDFTERYLKACEEYPDSIVGASR
jgi:hypothetical protein